MIHLKQDTDGFIRMGRRFPESVTIAITFSDGSTGEYSGRRLNGLYDQAVAAYRLGNNLDAKGFDRNDKRIHRKTGVDLVPVTAGMAP